MKVPTFERRDEITRLLIHDGFVSAVRLATMFDVTMETIRKDLLYLENTGVAHKEYGGARLSTIDIEQKLSVRLSNTSKKRQIAAAALSFLDDSKAVLIDAGTTCQEVARLLKNNKGMDVITNSLLAWEVLDGTDHNVLLTGGRKREKNQSLVGNWCVQAIISIHADICFLGTSGICDRLGPTSHSYQEIDVKQAMIKQSDRVYVLAGSDKFKETGFHTICSWDEIDAVITDSSLSSKLYEKYAKVVQVIIAQEDEDEKNS